MYKYVLNITRALDSIKLKYPGPLPFDKDSSELPDFYNNVESIKEEKDKLISEWILSRLGRISLGKDGSLYIFIKRLELQNRIETMFNALKDYVKNLELGDFVKPEIQSVLSAALINNDNSIGFIESDESYDIIGFNEWLFQEYNRILQDPVYSKAEESAFKELSIVYKVNMIFKLDREAYSKR